MKLSFADITLVTFYILFFIGLFFFLHRLPWYQQHLEPNWQDVQVTFLVQNITQNYLNYITPGLEERRNGDLRGTITSVKITNIQDGNYDVELEAVIKAKLFDNVLTYEKKPLHIDDMILFTSKTINLEGMILNITRL